MHRLFFLQLVTTECICILFVSVACEEVDDSRSRERRDIRMLRMGRSANADDYYANSFPEERQIYAQVPRLGREIPPMPRLGNEYEYLMKRLLDDRQTPWGVPRVGRFARSLDRISHHEDSENHAARAAPLPRLGLREYLERQYANHYNDERAAPLPRLGLRTEEDEDPEYRAAPLPRLGLREENDLDDYQRAVPFPRLGQRDLEDVSKRAVSMLRMGKREGEEDEEARHFLWLFYISISILKFCPHYFLTLLRCSNQGNRDPSFSTIQNKHQILTWCISALHAQHKHQDSVHVRLRFQSVELPKIPKTLPELTTPITPFHWQKSCSPHEGAQSSSSHIKTTKPSQHTLLCHS